MNIRILRRVACALHGGVDPGLSQRGARAKSGDDSRMEPDSPHDAGNAWRHQPDGILYARARADARG